MISKQHQPNPYNTKSSHVEHQLPRLMILERLYNCRHWFEISLLHMAIVRWSHKKSLFVSSLLCQSNPTTACYLQEFFFLINNKIMILNWLFFNRRVSFDLFTLIGDLETTKSCSKNQYLSSYKFSILPGL
jgi:hypothetical protein